MALDIQSHISLANPIGSKGCGAFELLFSSRSWKNYGLHLDWQVIAQAGQSGAVDLFLNFPVMDMNRNAIWRNPDKTPQDGIDRMTKFWGDEIWKQIAYAKHPQGNLFTNPDLVKQSNESVVRASQTRLKNVAGFAFVPDPISSTPGDKSSAELISK
jgi:three-Cys-motif partner protein